VLVDVLLWLPRTLASAWGWAWGRTKRHALNRQQLVKEGSEVVSRVQHFVESIGPTSIVWGTNEQASEYLQERHRVWHEELKGPLRAYANGHPSDEVRHLGRDVERMVADDLSATIYLLSSRNSADAGNAHRASAEAHQKAQLEAERLMIAIRAY
jgi:hypothetical protein